MPRKCNHLKSLLILFFCAFMPYLANAKALKCSFIMSSDASQKTPREKFVSAYLWANSHYPQINVGIRLNVLRFLLRSDVPLVAAFEPLADADVDVVGAQMSEIHKAMGIPFRYEPLLTPTDLLNQDIKKVPRKRVHGLMTTARDDALYRMIHVMKLFSREANSEDFWNRPDWDIMSNSEEVVHDVEAYLRKHPELRNKLDKFSEVLDRAFKDPKLRKTCLCTE